MKIYLFRHGEVFNPKHVLYGRLPGFHLSGEGRDHVRKTARMLKSAEIRKIYSSPMERAVETSQILIEALGLDKSDLIIDEGLIESDCQKWQGTSMPKFQERIHSVDWSNQDLIEPITESGARVQKVLDKISIRDENAVIVSHGDPITGALINIFHDWKIYNNHYIKRAEFVKLSYENKKFAIEHFSY